jgi:hypothetical protein
MLKDPLKKQNSDENGLATNGSHLSISFTIDLVIKSPVISRKVSTLFPSPSTNPDNGLRMKLSACF